MSRYLMGVLCGCLVAGASTAFAQIDARVDTNGIPKGYTVQKNGRTVCEAPQVWNGFRGEGSSIVCP
jgi:thiamine biosynthesis lipoprotein ApbE